MNEPASNAPTALSTVETAAETAFDASMAPGASAASRVPAGPARVGRAPALRRLFVALAWTLSASAGTLGLFVSTAAHAQGTGEPIVIPGPGEKNPDALAAMSRMVTSPAGASSSATAQRTNAGMQPLSPAQSTMAASMRPTASAGAPDRFEQAAKADGAIVIAGPGDASASRPGMASGLMRVNLPVAASQVMPVVVTPAAASVSAQGRETSVAPQAIAMNPPASAGYATTAPRFERMVPRAVPAQAAQTYQRVQPAQATVPGISQAPASNAQATQPAQAAQTAVPEGQQDGESIRRAALAWLQQQAAGLPGKVVITVANVFPRGLAACTTMQPFAPAGTRMWGRTTVGVRCAGERPWTLYLQAKISVEATYYTASRAIAPGEPLSAADLVARDGDLTLLPQAVVTDPSQAIGAVALVRVPAGLPLRQDMLRSASSVTIGQTVRVVAQGPGFSISSEGSAMNNAAPGQQVRVKTANGQIISGIVKEGGTVEIQL